MADPILGPVTDGDTFKATLWQSLFGQKVLNVLHYQCYDPTATPPDAYQVMKGLAGALADPTTGLWTQMRPMQGASLLHEKQRIQLLRGIAESFPYYDEAINEPGTAAFDCTLVNIAFSIEKKATFPPTKPRQGIGRMQVGGIPSNAYEDGMFSATYLGLWDNFIDQLPNNIVLAGGVGLRPVLASKGATLWLDQAIYQCLAHPEVRDMRGRTVGRGI